jgi:hypothetical protein
VKKKVVHKAQTMATAERSFAAATATDVAADFADVLTDKSLAF